MGAGQHLIEKHAGAVDVGAQIERNAAHLLGTHIARCAEDLAAPGAVDRVDMLGDAEIEDGQAAIGAEHEVLRLQIAMQHALLVDVAEREHQLAEDLQRLVGLDRLVAEPLVQVAAIEEFHDQVRMLAGDAVAVDARHVAAADALDQVVLFHEARQRVLVSHHLASEDLDHQGLVVVFRRREVDPRHAAFADQAQHLDPRNADARAELVPFHARGDLGRHGLLQRALRQLADRGDQLLARQLLLALIVVRAVLHRAHGDRFVARAGEEKHRRAVAAGLEIAQPLEAVAAPEHVVEDHGVEFAERERSIRHLALERIEQLDLERRPFQLEVAREDVPQILVVVDDQDLHGSPACLATLPRLSTIPPRPARLCP